MQIKRLDHVNIRTNQLQVMIDWYSNVLGMTVGDRPNFSFPGAWLYVAGVASVHLVDIKNSNAVGSETELKLEHFAFSATGLNEFEEKLKRLGLPYHRAEIPGFNIIQINIWDPDGNHLHLDFDANE